MRPILLHVTRFYLALSVLVGVPAGAGRAVLCLAPNSHVAIEVDAGRCADYPQTPRGELEILGMLTLPDGCGDCVDLPLGTQIVSAAHHRVLASTSSNATPAPCICSVTGGRVMEASVRPTPPRRTGRAFPPSRSTILRI